MINRVPGMVSIIITNYNRAKYLKECLDSLHHQSYSNKEIILVDDASTDHSATVVNEWREDNSIHPDQLTLVRLPRNVGFSGAMTTGFYMARGEFIAVQDSDDFSHVRRLEKQVLFLRNHSEIALVGSNYASFEDRDKRQYIPANWLKYGDEILPVYRHGGHCVCHGTIMFRAAIFDRIGGLTRRIDGAEDYEFIVKFLEIGARIENIPDILYYYRTHSNQRSHVYFGTKE